MSAHDPRVTLTEAEVERLYDDPAPLPQVVADLIAARLAPIRALADAWDAWDGSPGPDGGMHPDSSSPRDRDRLRAALDAPVSASQDHAWHQPLTHCHCGRVIPCRHHDGAEGQGEGETAGGGENWNPNTMGPDCDWCGECDWCLGSGEIDLDAEETR